MKTVLISGADRNIGLELVKQFLGRGWKVLAGRFLMDLPFLDELQREYPDSLILIPLDVSGDESVKAAAEAAAKQVDHLDMLVHNAASFGGAPKDFDGYIKPYDINCLGAMRLVHSFLPLMQTGMKRLCFISSEAGSVSVAHRDELSSYCMSKTALNMALRLMFNQLQPQGYSFRLFHPGWVLSDMIEHADEVGKAPKRTEKEAGQYWPWEAAAAATEQFLEDRDWEDRMVILDVEGCAWPF